MENVLFGMNKVVPQGQTCTTCNIKGCYNYGMQRCNIYRIIITLCGGHIIYIILTFVIKEA